MLERILLAPGANGTELLRSMAMHGVNTIALRVMGGTELSQLALMRSGVADDRLFLTRSDEAGVIYQILSADPDLVRGTLSIEQCRDIADALRSLRHLVPEDEEQNIITGLEKGKFKDKNKWLANIYRKYIGIVGKSGSVLALNGEKAPQTEDAVMLIRRAIEQAQPIEAEFLILNEFPLSPLEKALLNKLSGDSFRTLSLPELYGKETAKESANEPTDEPTEPAAAKSITSAYGSTNEVEDIIARIYESKLPLDSCTVAVTDTRAYSQLFYDYALRHDVPVTFGCGVPIVNSNPAKLLVLYIEWFTNGGRGVAALQSMLYSDACDRGRLIDHLKEKVPGFERLDKVIELTGSLRLGGEQAENDLRVKNLRDVYKNIKDEEERAGSEQLLDCAAVLGELLSRGAQSFCAEYSAVRSGLPGRIDRAARPVIGGGLTSAVFAGDILESADMLLQRSVCMENSCPGHLHVTGIPQALSSLRSNLFVAGLSADRFPGGPVENYLLLDKDYGNISKDSYAPTSDAVITAAKKSFADLTALAGALGVPVHLSWPDYSLTGLNEENKSSVLFELGGSGNITERSVGYFDHVSSLSSLVGAEYLEGHRTVKTQENNDDPSNITVGWKLSPTAIEKFVQCPRKFYLNVILGLKEPEDDRQDDIISAADQGTFIHKLMEMFVDCQPEESVFMSEAVRLFDEHLVRCVPAPGTEDRVEKARNEFLDIARNAYRLPKNKVVHVEKDLTGTIEDISVGGKVDCIEQQPDGSYIVVDYKTGRKVKQKKGDVSTCIQTMLYAHMLEQSGTKVDHCEYRYPRSGTTVVCEVSDITRNALKDIMQSLQDALDTGVFACTLDDDACKYCPVKSICGKESK